MIVETNKLSLSYPIYQFEKSLRKKILRSSEPIKYVDALKDINFNIYESDRVGIMGTNGSGKTSLLKVLAGIYFPSSGQIKVSKNPFSLFDTEMGLNHDATGIENLNFIKYLRGIENLNDEKILEEIINFSELGEFINYPVRTYSSGMKVRLATAIAMSLKPDLLIIDEFFGAGDQKFKEKSSDAFRKKLLNTSAVVFASHDEKLVESICNRIIILEKGKIIKDEKN